MRKILFFVFISVSLAVIDACNLSPDNATVPNGNSSLTAEIHDTMRVFSFKNTPAHLFGVSTVAMSGKYELSIFINYTDLGTYKWQSGYYGQFGQDAMLNGKEALNGIGELTVTHTDLNNRLVQGTFEFAVVDSSRTDTTYVKNGSFTFYYVEVN
jgi:hypothetical protein